jgi:hypothetical protein
VLDFNLSVADLQRQRNSMDECVAFIVSELRAAAELLPYDQPTHYFGRPTKGAAQAIISELLLYYARPLFNGNARYANLRNPDGSHIFPGIATMDPTRWRDAAAAAKAIIDMNHYSLYAPTGNPYQDFNRIFLDNWNEETIWGRFFGGNHLRIRITPRGIGSNAWGAVAPTQQLVDAFSMKNGRYPVIRRNEDGSPVIDPLAEYSETGFTNMVHPLDRGQNNVAPAARSTFNMYVNREPRFYTTILWSDARWPYNIWLAPNGTDGVVSFAFNGNSGPGPSHNHSRTGYMFRKFTNHTVNTAGGSWGNLVWPIFRYANTLLNYIEALNEYNPSHPDILIYWNQLRVRAGVPPIQEVFPERMGNQAEVRDLIRRERQVELAFEHKRFFDTRTWMIAEQTDNGPMWGMNNHPSAAVTSGPNTTPPEFWQRHSFSTRVFAPRHYLHPFPQGELDRNKLITQNYGW